MNSYMLRYITLLRLVELVLKYIHLFYKILVAHTRQVTFPYGYFRKWAGHSITAANGSTYWLGSRYLVDSPLTVLLVILKVSQPATDLSSSLRVIAPRQAPSRVPTTWVYLTGTKTGLFKFIANVRDRAAPSKCEAEATRA